MSRGLGQPGIGGDASVAAFPLGGIGTGNVSLGARGELRDWELCNAPAKGNTLPFTFFALHARGSDVAPVTKILESRLRPPHEFENGYMPGAVAGFPRFHDSELRGEYPFAWVELFDETVPFGVFLEAFTPLVPLDADASGLPVAVLRYRVHNPTAAPLEVTIVGTVINPIGSEQSALGLEAEGRPMNKFRSTAGLRGLEFTSSLSANAFRSGTIVLATTAANVTAKPDWPAPLLGNIDEFWNDLREDGRLDFDTSDEAWEIPLAKSARHAADNPQLEAFYLGLADLGRRNRLGSLGIVQTVEAKTDAIFEFLLTWHFPNRRRAWGDALMDNTNVDEVVRNYYATRHEDAWAVAQHLATNLPALERETRAFHQALHCSTLEPEVVDALATSVATLRTTTCFRLEDGTFAGWEGSTDKAGSWSGTCTHVWSYAQTGAFLFPELERSMRRVEFLLETEPDGRMNFRTNRIFGAAPFGFLPAVDGQLASVVRVYRDWKLSGDEAFLRELWPNVLKSAEFSAEHWDPDGDGVIEAPHHTTYDIEFHGPTAYANAVYFAAARAVAEMANHLGEAEVASRWSGIAIRGAEAMDRLLWNGEYYVQGIDDPNAEPFQFGEGCLSAQLFGQFLASVAGLGYVLPADHVKRTLAAIVEYNFVDLRLHEVGLRALALGDESGLVNCSWPRGGRPHRPLHLASEVWSGTEYMVAAQLVYEQLLDPALEIVRAVRRRHDGYRRSPWNEIEAGYHYARSMSAWALVLAWSGFYYDVGRGALGFFPRVEQLTCIFSTGTAWGVFSHDAHRSSVIVRGGRLVLSELRLPPVDRDAALQISLGEQSLAPEWTQEATETIATFDRVELLPGDELIFAA